MEKPLMVIGGKTSRKTHTITNFCEENFEENIYNTRSQSLKVYTEKNKPKYSIRILTKNFGIDNNIKSIPLYAVFCIK